MKIVTNAPPEAIIDRFYHIYNRFMVSGTFIQTIITADKVTASQIGFILVQMGWEVEKYS